MQNNEYTVKNVRVLDCTLRDGSHLNNGFFGVEIIKGIINELVKAKIDIIELGFLSQDTYNPNRSTFRSISDAKTILPLDFGISKFSLMIEKGDVDNLENYDGSIEYIRVIFKRNRIAWAKKTITLLINKGFKVIVNPVNINVYPEIELVGLIKVVNTLKPHGFSIVDTFGALKVDTLSNIYKLADKLLTNEIIIGVHLHENLGLSLTLANHILNIRSKFRNHIIDSSLMGMGRDPGNLATEKLMHLLESHSLGEFKAEHIYLAISKYILTLHNSLNWGFKIPYLISGLLGIHRTYAEYLINKGVLDYAIIYRILESIDTNEVEYYNETHISRLLKDKKI